tara:strand:+ start:334 stop:540 length:207 start_codon:yes stop_codon:yes gene_type:complete
MKYIRKLTSKHYNGCNNRLARSIDMMAGLIPDSLAKEYALEWRGMNRTINSKNDDIYYKQKEKQNETD